MAQRTPHLTGSAEQAAALEAQGGGRDFHDILKQYSKRFPPDSQAYREAEEQLKKMPEDAMPNAESLQYVQMKAYMVYNEFKAFFANVPGFEIVPSFAALDEEREPRPEDPPITFGYVPISHTFQFRMGIRFRQALPDEDDHWITTFRRNAHEHIFITRHPRAHQAYIVKVELSPMAPESRQPAPGQTLNITQPVSAFDIIAKTKPHLLPAERRQRTQMDTFVSTAGSEAAAPAATPSKTGTKRKRASANVATGGQRKRKKVATPATTAATSTSTTPAATGDPASTPSKTPPKRSRGKGGSGRGKGKGKSKGDDGDAAAPATPQRPVCYSVAGARMNIGPPPMTSTLLTLVTRMTKLGTEASVVRNSSHVKFLRMQMMRMVTQGQWVQLHDTITAYLHYCVYRIVTDGKVKGTFSGLVYHFFKNWCYISFKDSLKIIHLDAVCATTGQPLTDPASAVAIYVTPPVRPSEVGAGAEADAGAGMDVDAEVMKDGEVAGDGSTGRNEPLPANCTFQYWIHRKKMPMVESVRAIFRMNQMVETLRESLGSGEEGEEGEKGEEGKEAAADAGEEAAVRSGANIGPAARERIIEAINDMLTLLTANNRTLRRLYTTYTLTDLPRVD